MVYAGNMNRPGLSAEIRREFPAEYAPPKYEVADVVRRYGDLYRAEHTPSFEQAHNGGGQVSYCSICVGTILPMLQCETGPHLCVTPSVRYEGCE